jgi:hypothetical protein
MSFMDRKDPVMTDLYTIKTCFGRPICRQNECDDKAKNNET